jgi:hypothetical protein
MRKFKILTKFIFAISLAIFALSLNSCIHENFEEPAITNITEGTSLTLDQVYQIFNDSVLSLGKQSYKFEDDYSVCAVVSMDDKSGNIYKSAYVQDISKGINLHLMSSGGLYEGDSIRIKLQNLVLSEYAGMLQIDSVLVDKNIVKLATLKNLKPQTVTIDQILTGQYIAKLVKIENVQFVEADLGTQYADAVNLITLNKTLEDEQGRNIIVRTSGYASFAKMDIPSGRGDIIAVVGKFNDDWQLFIRSIYEVKFTKRRFGDVDINFSEDFAGITNGTELDLDGWYNIAKTGSLKWMGFNNAQGAEYVKIDGNSSASETYLILPKQNLSNNKISFRTRAGNLVGAKLELVISNDFNGSNIETATWTVIPANFATAPSSGFGNWLESGEVDLSSYSGKYYIGFRYIAQLGQKANFMLDDILIYSND